MPLSPQSKLASAEPNQPECSDSGEGNLPVKYPSGWSALASAAIGVAAGHATIWLGSRMQAGWVQAAGIAILLSVPPLCLGAYTLGKVPSDLVRSVLSVLAAGAILFLVPTIGASLKEQNLPDQTKLGIAIATLFFVMRALKAAARFGEVELKRRKHGRQASG